MKPDGSAKASEAHHSFYCDGKGNVHVDTFINGERWQHHVHSADAFAGWSGLMVESELIGLPDRDCACDLVPGQVLEHDGRIWNHPQFVSSLPGLMWTSLSFINGQDREPIPQP